MPPPTTTATTTLTLAPPTSPPTYIYALSTLPTTLAAITSTDTLHLFTPTLLHTRALGTHPTITSLCSAGAHGLLTAGRDGCVRMWDVRTGSGSGSGSGGCVRTWDAGAAALCVASGERGADGGILVAAGTEVVGNGGGVVVVWDTRTTTTAPRARYTESHNDDITTLLFHRSRPWLVSGGTDALLNVYDLSIPVSGGGGVVVAAADDDADGVLRTTVNHGAAVQKAGWVGGGLGVVSTDEKVAVYSVAEEEDGDGDGGGAEVDWGDVRGVLGCEYVVDILGLSGRDDGVLVAGSGSGAWVDLVPFRRTGGQGWEMGRGEGEGVRLVDAHAGEVVRDVLVDEGAGVVYTAGEDGRVAAWRMPAGNAAAAVEVAEKAPRGGKERRKEKGRYKPY